MQKYRAYHWSRNDDRLGYNDGRKIVLGETLSVNCKPILCKQGLHGSQSIVDALGYASGSHLWIVDIWGDMTLGEDKLCGKNRTAVVEFGDLLPVIVEFAYWCDERAQRYAQYAAKNAQDAAKYEKDAQEKWWEDKLHQIKNY